MKLTKASYRKEVRALLDAIPKQEHEILSKKLTLELKIYLQSLEIDTSVANILAFAPIQKEPKLNWKDILEQPTTPNVYMACFSVEKYIHPNVKSKFFDDFSKIDILVLPGMAFTEGGYRLGRGGGWYDRVIANKLRKDCIKIGICYQMQMVPNLEMEPHDQQLNAIITESKKYEF